MKLPAAPRAAPEVPVRRRVQRLGVPLMAMRGVVFGVCVEDWVSAALRVKGEKRGLHGHDYIVRVCAEGDLDEVGMVVDHSILYRLLRGCLDSVDYRVLNEVLSVESATAERLVGYVYDCVSSKLKDYVDASIVYVEACTPRGYCSYLRAGTIYTLQRRG